MAFSCEGCLYSFPPTLLPVLDLVISYSLHSAIELTCSTIITMGDKDVEMTAYESKELHTGSNNEEALGSNRDEQEMAYYGKQQQLKVRYSRVAAQICNSAR